MNKLQELQQSLQQHEVDAAYISNFEDIQYFTGFGSDPIERVLALFVFPDDDPFLFAPALEVEDIQKSGWPYAWKVISIMSTHFKRLLITCVVGTEHCTTLQLKRLI